MKIGFCFAGQGSQKVGMGQDFYNSRLDVKKIYDEFPDIRDLCFYDKSGVLNETKYAQKAMLLTSFSIATALKNEGISPDFVCGLSLGEYSALTFAKIWNLDDAIKIITKRGEIMQNALPLGSSKMSAVLGLDRETILSTISSIDGVVEIANYNCPGQIVITGESRAVELAGESLMKAGAKRVIELNVSGAFHSSLLNSASNDLRKVLDLYQNQTPIYRVVYNISGKEETMPLNDILQKQICNSVYFEDSIKYMIENGVDTFVEIGPGRTLSSFIKKINKDVKVFCVNDTQSFNETLEGLKNESSN